MKIPRYLQSFAGIFQMCLFVIAMYLIWLESASASQVSSNIISKPSLLDVLAGVLNDRELIQREPKAKAQKFLDKKKIDDRPMKNSRSRSDLLRQELDKETQDNCLAKLLCETPPKKPERPDVFGDFGNLVKEFFDVFDFATNDPTIGERGNNTKTAEDEDKVNNDDDEDDDEENDTEGRSENPETVRITGSISDVGDDLNEIVTTSTSATITEITTGASMTDIPVPPTTSSSTEIKKMTLEELIGDVTLTPEDFDRLRRSRSMLFTNEPKQSSYIKRKIRELRLANTETKKLKIARKIASRMREPKQCRQFQNAASEILSTCPLTSEVVRYFNLNLKNGSQIAIVNNPANPHPNDTVRPGGLVLLNDVQDRPHAYFLDNNPTIANTRITTDIKNPTVPERYPVDLEYQIYENAFPQVQNVKKVSITKAPQKSEDSGSDENENNDDDEDDDNEDEEEGEEDDEDTNDDDDDDQNDIDEDNDRQRASSKRKKNFLKKHRPDGEEGPPPRPDIPSGIIKVYGVPQPSFDNEFSQISTQIGSGPVIIFDQDDFDANDPHPGPPVQPPRSRPAVKNAPKDQSKNRRRSQALTTLKPVQYMSDEDSEENEEDYENPNVFRNNGPPPPRTYMNHNNNGYDGPPAPLEYYRHSMPPRPMPMYRQVNRPINLNPESSVRGRLNFIPNPGAGLLRPGMYPSRNFRFFGK